MQRKLVLTVEAEQNLDQIYSYIYEQSQSYFVAEKYVTSILDFIRKLEVFPFLGTIRDEIKQNLRTVGFKKRVTVAFMITDEEIIIYGIFYGGQQITIAEQR
jgi:toxin ParE1/3/4